jgi:hypothetical protein
MMYDGVYCICGLDIFSLGMICDGKHEVGIARSEPGWWLLLEGNKVKAYRCPLETCTILALLPVCPQNSY